MKGVNRVWHFVALCGFSVVAGGAFAQADAAWKAVQAAALKEGKVVLYAAPTPPTLARLKADFEKAHPGIALEPVRMVGGVLTGKFETERDAKADGGDVLVAPELLWLDTAAKQGALKAPTGPAARGWPAKYMIGGVAPMLTLEPMVMVYNTNLVKTPVTGYQDLLKPEYKGRTGTFGPIAPVVVAWYDWLEKTHGADFLGKYATQDPKVYPSSVASTQAVASGELMLNTFSQVAFAQPLIDQGAPMRIVMPKPAFGIAYGAGIVGWSKRPNAAQVLVDYLMSPRGQAAFIGKGEMAAVVPNVPNSMDPNAISVFEASRFTPEVVKAFTERFNNTFKAR